MPVAREDQIAYQDVGVGDYSGLARATVDVAFSDTRCGRCGHTHRHRRCCGRRTSRRPEDAVAAGRADRPGAGGGHRHHHRHRRRRPACSRCRGRRFDGVGGVALPRGRDVDDAVAADLDAQRRPRSRRRLWLPSSQTSPGSASPLAHCTTRTRPKRAGTVTSTVPSDFTVNVLPSLFGITSFSTVPVRERRHHARAASCGRRRARFAELRARR